LVLEDGADVTHVPAPFWVHTATPVLWYYMLVSPLSEVAGTPIIS